MTSTLDGSRSADVPSRPASRLRRARAWCDAHARQLALSAVLLSLTLAGGYAATLGDTVRYLDEQAYPLLARSLAAGTGYSYDGVEPTAFQPPGYPFLLTPIALLTDAPSMLRLVGLAALAGSVWLVYLLGRRISPATGAMAALLIACYPLLTYTATTLYPQVPALFLLLLHLELGLRAVCRSPGESRRRWPAALGSGLAGGLLVLTVPTFGPSLMVVLGLMLWLDRRGAARARAVCAAALVAGLIALLVGGWTARNAVTMGQLVPVANNAGLNLLLGNNEKATAQDGASGDVGRYHEQARVQGLSEVEKNRYMTREALRWMGENPGRAATLYLAKLANTFAYRNELATAGQRDPLKDLVAALTFYPVLALAAVRLLLIRRCPLHPVELIGICLLLVNILVQAVFFTRVRFRVPLDALMIVAAAGAVAHLLGWRRLEPCHRPAAGTVAAGEEGQAPRGS